MVQQAWPGFAPKVQKQYLIISIQNTSAQSLCICSQAALPYKSFGKGGAGRGEPQGRVKREGLRVAGEMPPLQPAVALTA